MSNEATDRGDTYRSVWRHMMTTPFKQDFIDAGGVRTRYVQAGRPDAPAVLLLHGTGGHWEAFCANIGPLSEHFNVYALDLLGCGFSDKPDRPYEIADYRAQVLAFMDAMGIDKAGIVGVSLGSWVTASLALENPDRVERIVLIAPAGFLALPKGVKQAIDTRRDSGLNPSWDKISATLADLYYDRSSVIDDIVAVRQQVYRLPDMDRIMPRILTLFDPEIRARNIISADQWRNIQTPTLIIAHVDVDDMFLETARAVAGLLPNAQTAEITQVSHWAQFERPEAFNAVAIDFLKG